MPILFLWLCVEVSGVSQWSTCALDDADSVSYHADHGIVLMLMQLEPAQGIDLSLGDHKTSSSAHRPRCSSHVAYELQS